MKKITSMVLVMVLFISTLAINNISYAMKNPNNQKHITTKKAQEEKALKDIFNLAAVGKVRVKNKIFGLGSNLDDLIKNLGVPKTSDYYQGAYYVDYPSYRFYIGEKDKVIGFSILGKTVGNFKVTDIKRVLGKPDDEGIDEDNGGYYLYYDKNYLSVFFFFPDKNKSLLSIEVDDPNT